MKVKIITVRAATILSERARKHLEQALANNSIKRPQQDSRLMWGIRKTSFTFGENTIAVVEEKGGIVVATGEFYPQYADITDTQTRHEPRLYTAKLTKSMYKVEQVKGHSFTKPLTEDEQVQVIRAAVRFFAENNVRFSYADEPEINAAFCPTDEDKKQLIDLITESALGLVNIPNFDGTYADIWEIQKCLNYDTYTAITNHSPDFKQNSCFRKAHALLERKSRANAINLWYTLNESWLKVCRYAFEFYIHKYLHIAGRSDCIHYLLRYWAGEMGVQDMHENQALVIAAETADLNKSVWEAAKHGLSLDTLDKHFEQVFSGE